MIRCIVFDFDGTLVVSNHIKRQIFYEVTYSHDPSGAIVTHILNAYPNKDRYGLFLEIAHKLCANNHMAKDQNTKTLASQLAEAYTLRCEQAIGSCEEVPGTSHTLRWIHQHGIPIFINSRTPTATLKHMVTLRSFHHYISGIFGASANKSDNLWEIQSLTKTKPQDIILVGDSEDDRKASLDVGCHFVGVTLWKESRFTDPPPSTQVTDLYQLQPIVETMHGKGSQVEKPIEANSGTQEHRRQNNESSRYIYDKDSFTFIAKQ